MKSATDMVLERLLVRKRSTMVCLSADSWHCGIQKGTDNGKFDVCIDHLPVFV